MELGSDLAEKLLSHDLMCVDGAFTSHQSRTFSQRAVESVVEHEICLLNPPQARVRKPPFQPLGPQKR